jgi:dephospho-CoA kinase
VTGEPAGVAPARPLSIGLTGNAASGKSTVASWWEAAGVPVVRADDLAREVVAPGSPGLAAVVEAFGTDVLVGAEVGTGTNRHRTDGHAASTVPSAVPTLDRAALRARILTGPEARSRLEAILHPRIHALREAWLAARAAEGHPLVVSEIPLLFEAGLESSVDRIVLVRAPREACLARLTSERGLPTSEAEALLAAQIPPDKAALRAHHVLRNDGSLAAFQCAAGILLDTLQEEASRAQG